MPHTQKTPHAGEKKPDPLPRPSLLPDLLLAGKLEIDSSPCRRYLVRHAGSRGAASFCRHSARRRELSSPAEAAVGLSGNWITGSADWNWIAMTWEESIGSLNYILVLQDGGWGGSTRVSVQSLRRRIPSSASRPLNMRGEAQ